MNAGSAFPPRAWEVMLAALRAAESALSDERERRAAAGDDMPDYLDEISGPLFEVRAAISKAEQEAET